MGEMDDLYEDTDKLFVPLSDTAPLLRKKRRRTKAAHINMTSKTKKASELLESYESHELHFRFTHPNVLKTMTFSSLPMSSYRQSLYQQCLTNLKKKGISDAILTNVEMRSLTKSGLTASYVSNTIDSAFRHVLKKKAKNSSDVHIALKNYFARGTGDENAAISSMCEKIAVRWLDMDYYLAAARKLNMIHSRLEALKTIKVSDMMEFIGKDLKVYCDAEKYHARVCDWAYLSRELRKDVLNFSIYAKFVRVIQSSVRADSKTSDNIICGKLRVYETYSEKYYALRTYRNLTTDGDWQLLIRILDFTSKYYKYSPGAKYARSNYMRVIQDRVMKDFTIKSRDIMWKIVLSLLDLERPNRYLPIEEMDIPSVIKENVVVAHSDEVPTPKSTKNAPKQPETRYGTGGVDIDAIRRKNTLDMKRAIDLIKKKYKKKEYEFGRFIANFSKMAGNPRPTRKQKQLSNEYLTKFKKYIKTNQEKTGKLMEELDIWADDGTNWRNLTRLNSKIVRECVKKGTTKKHKKKSKSTSKRTKDVHIEKDVYEVDDSTLSEEEHFSHVSEKEHESIGTESEEEIGAEEDAHDDIEYESSGSDDSPYEEHAHMTGETQERDIVEDYSSDETQSGEVAAIIDPKVVNKPPPPPIPDHHVIMEDDEYSEDIGMTDLSSEGEESESSSEDEEEESSSEEELEDTKKSKVDTSADIVGPGTPAISQVNTKSHKLKRVATDSIEKNAKKGKPSDSEEDYTDWTDDQHPGYYM